MNTVTNLIGIHRIVIGDIQTAYPDGKSLKLQIVGMGLTQLFVILDKPVTCKMYKKY